MLKSRSKSPKGLSCPECGGTRIWKAGQCYTAKGARQRYQCADCRRFFIEEQS